MNKTIILSCLCVGALIGTGVPVELVAKTTHSFNAALNEQATEIQSLVFGSAIKIAGVLGAAFLLFAKCFRNSINHQLKAN